MKSGKLSLQTLVEKIDWIMIEPQNRPQWGLAADAVSVTFHDPSKVGKVNRVRIRIGHEVCALLKWEKGDKICIFQDPDHLLTFRLVKSNSGVGYKLTKEASSNFIHLLNFTWMHNIPLTAMKSKIVEYYIHKGNQLLFQVEN